MKRESPSREALVGAILAAYFFLLVLGPEVLNPGETKWLMSDDPGTHYLGAQLYLREPWAFPLTRVNTFIFPIGSTLIQTDSIPVVGLFFKLLSSLIPGGLPFPFQYFGMWLFSCYALLGFFSFRLFAKMGATRWQAALGSLLAVCSPTFINRFGHNALCAQWLVVAMLEVAWDWYHSTREKFPWKKTAAVTAFAVGTHAYLAFLCVVMSFALFIGAWRVGHQTRNERLKEWGTWSALQITWAGMLGYFAVSHPKAGMFTEFGLDLTSFFNPGHRSAYFPELFPPNIENMAYLGLGIGIFLLLGAAVAVKNRRAIPPLFRDRSTRVFCLLIVGLFFYSFSPSITWKGQKLFSLLLLYKLITPIPDIFRACGRFVWPPYYAAFFAAGLTLIRFVPKRATTVVLMTALMLQWGDLGGWFSARATRLANGVKTEEAPLPPPTPGVTELRLVPPYLPDGDYECGDGRSFAMPIYLATGVYAAHYRLRFNSGFASRPFPGKLRELCRKTTAAWTSAPPEPSVAYLIRPELRRPSTHDCTPWNGLFYCQPKPL